MLGCILGKKDGTVTVGDRVLDTDFNVNSFPVKNGVVQNWDDMITIWTHLFQQELCDDPKDYRVLLSKPLGNPKQYREKAGEIMFENFGVKAVCFGNEHVLAVASGKLYGGSGISITSGHGHTNVVPVVDMRAITDASYSLPFSGSKVDEYLLGEIKEKSQDFCSRTSVQVLLALKF